MSIKGQIPENWIEVALQNGYYIGFPEIPEKTENSSNQSLNYKLEQNNLILSLNITDLSNEISFRENKNNITAYYRAVLEDLSKDLKGKIEEQLHFVFDESIEGLKAQLIAKDEQIYLQFVIIENTLYTASIIIFEEEDPSILQLKNNFFYSFRKKG